MMRNRLMYRKVLPVLLIFCFVINSLTGCGTGSQHLEMKYEENDNENISNWDDVDDSITTWDDVDDGSITTWDDAVTVSWSDIDEYSDWVYAELLFEEITDEMPVIECRILDYQSNGKYFDGEKIYQMVGDKFDVNSFVAKYAVGTGVIIICVVLNVVTAGITTPVTCFIAGAADASVSMAIKGSAFGAAARAIVQAIKSEGNIEETIYGALEGSADGYMWGAIYGAVTGGFKSKYCFTEDTLVLTNYGLQKISDINVGTLVYAYDENTGSYAYKPVTQVNVGETCDTICVYVGDGVIECTPTHPFFTDIGWVQASQLEEGNKVLSKDKIFLKVSSVDVKSYKSPISTYTLCVDEYHSFLVGSCGIVVHNKCKPNEKYANSTYKFPDGSEQATKYPNGVPFDAEGYPVFNQYAIATVKFDFPSLEGKLSGKCLIGNCTSDFTLAKKAAGLDSIPPGYTWHHCQDMRTMQLVPQDVHSVIFGGVPHAGGESALHEFWETLTSK